MNNEIKDFIFSIADFNSCEFCNKFNLRVKCPGKNFYNEEEEPSVEKNQGRWKYVQRFHCETS